MERMDVGVVGGKEAGTICVGLVTVSLNNQIST